VDSLENITHSLCTLEFESRRASYYWLLEARRPKTVLAPALSELVHLLHASTAPAPRRRPGWPTGGPPAPSGARKSARRKT